MSKAVEQVLVGDLHLDKEEAYFPDSHLELQYHEIEKPFKYAIKNGVKYVVLLGDIGHRERLSEEAQIMFLKLLSKYDGKLEIDVILGNHDIAHKGLHSLQLFCEMCKARMFKTVRIHAKPVQRVIHDIPFNFLPFPEKRPIPAPKGMIDKTVNFAHLERPGALRDNGSKLDKKSGTEGDDNLWVIGHLHTPQKLGTSYFPGTLYQTNFGESLPKRFLHLKTRNKNGKLKYEMKSIPVDPTFKLINLKIEAKSDLKKIDNNPLHLYKVFIKKGVELPYDLLTKHKNIYRSPIGYKNAPELEEIMEEETYQDDVRLTDNLGKELRKRGATKAQRKRGKKIVKRIVGRM